MGQQLYPEAAFDFSFRRPLGGRPKEFPDIPREQAIYGSGANWHLDPYGSIPGLTSLPEGYPNTRGDTPESLLLPYNYNPSIQTGNIAVGSALDQMGGVGGNIYAPPAAGRMQNTVGALKGMTGSGIRSTLSDRGSNFHQSDMDSLGVTKQREMMMREPERIAPLLEILMAASQTGGKTVAGAINKMAQRQKIYESYRAGREKIKDETLGQTPLIGGILKGFL